MLDKQQKEVKGGNLSLVWHHTQQGPFDLTLSLYQFGRDYLALLGGGEAHLGAVQFLEQLWVPAPHKEGPLVKKLATAIGPLVKGELLVIAGIHFDNLNWEQINQILAQVDQLTRRFKKDFSPPQKSC